MSALVVVSSFEIRRQFGGHWPIYGYRPADRRMCCPATDCKVGLNKVQAKPLFADDIWALVNTPPTARHHF